MVPYSAELDLPHALVGLLRTLREAAPDLVLLDGPWRNWVGDSRV
ncbi:hypothetical protein [Streptomyces sp. NPDC127108]